MSLKPGDILVFIGNKYLQDKHFDNFEIGKSYKVLRIETIGYDIDEVIGYNNKCVIFENFSYGCLLSNLDIYFRKIEEHRNIKIDYLFENLEND